MRHTCTCCSRYTERQGEREIDRDIDIQGDRKDERDSAARGVQAMSLAHRYRANERGRERERERGHKVWGVGCRVQGVGVGCGV